MMIIANILFNVSSLIFFPQQGFGFQGLCLRCHMPCFIVCCVEWWVPCSAVWFDAYQVPCHSVWDSVRGCVVSWGMFHVVPYRRTTCCAVLCAMLYVDLYICMIWCLCMCDDVLYAVMCDLRCVVWHSCWRLHGAILHSEFKETWYGTKYGTRIYGMKWHNLFIPFLLIKGG